MKPPPQAVRRNPLRPSIRRNLLRKSGEPIRARRRRESSFHYLKGSVQSKRIKEI